MQRLITVGLPVYNGMPYLEETMNSLLRQTFTEFDILVIDDGSTDDSLAYLNSLNDTRLTVLTQKNSGLTATLNRMLAEVHTPWLARQDADDIAYPQRLRRTIEYIASFPEAGMFYSLADYYPSTSVGTFRTTKAAPPELREITKQGYLLSICHPTVTLNVEKARAIGGYRFDLHVEDVDMWWRMALRYDIRFIPEATVGYRQNVAGICSRNLHTQALHTAYIQYLLLSSLWKLTPKPFESVEPVLSEIVDDKKLAFREHLRAASHCISEGKYAAGSGRLLRAFFSSPSALAARLMYELRGHSLCFLGESPTEFARRKDLLWQCE